MTRSATEVLRVSQATRRRRLSPALAAALSFVLPGLGQAYAGQRGRAFAWAVPTLAVVALVVGLLVVNRDLGYVAGILIQPGSLAIAVVVDLAFLVYRVAAIVDAYRVAARAMPRVAGAASKGIRVGLAATAALLVVTITAQGLVAWVGWNAYDLVSGVFGSGSANAPDWGDGGAALAEGGAPTDVAEQDAVSSPGAAASPGSGATLPTDGVTSGGTIVWTPQPGGTASPAGSPSGATPSPTATDAGVPYWAEDGRLDLLVLGGDAGPGRDGLRTDSMMVVSVDVASGRAAIFGFPRNLVNVPLPPRIAKAYKCHCFPEMLSGYFRWAQTHPDLFSGSKTTRGYRAVAELFGYLTGRTIDGVAAADLNGFIRLVDALGGLRIDVPYRIYDRNYPKEDGSGTMVLEIQPGLQTLSGSTALAFARTRHQDSDYGRMNRQQLVLVALRKQLNPCAMIPRLPDLVKVAKESLWTNIPSSQLPSLLALAEQMDLKRITRVAFTPSKYAEFVTADEVTRIRAVIRDVFKGAPPAPAPDDGGGFFHC
ncbi:MAG: LCP family protein [Chloroflexota bacterium]